MYTKEQPIYRVAGPPRPLDWRARLALLASGLTLAAILGTGLGRGPDPGVGPAAEAPAGGGDAGARQALVGQFARTATPARTLPADGLAPAAAAAAIDHGAPPRFAAGVVRPVGPEPVFIAPAFIAPAFGAPGSAPRFNRAPPFLPAPPMTDEAAPPAP